VVVKFIRNYSHNPLTLDAFNMEIGSAGIKLFITFLKILMILKIVIGSENIKSVGS
jgi:hypothetical protein